MKAFLDLEMCLAELIKMTNTEPEKIFTVTYDDVEKIYQVISPNNLETMIADKSLGNNKIKMMCAQKEIHQIFNIFGVELKLKKKNAGLPEDL